MILYVALAAYWLLIVWVLCCLKARSRKPVPPVVPSLPASPLTNADWKRDLSLYEQGKMTLEAFLEKYKDGKPAKAIDPVEFEKRRKMVRDVWAKQIDWDKVYAPAVTTYHALCTPALNCGCMPKEGVPSGYGWGGGGGSRGSIISVCVPDGTTITSNADAAPAGGDGGPGALNPFIQVPTDYTTFTNIVTSCGSTSDNLAAGTIYSVTSAGDVKEVLYKPVDYSQKRMNVVMGQMPYGPLNTAKRKLGS